MEVQVGEEGVEMAVFVMLVLVLVLAVKVKVKAADRPQTKMLHHSMCSMLTF
jgi:hypothetical protein